MMGIVVLAFFGDGRRRRQFIVHVKVFLFVFRLLGYGRREGKACSQCGCYQTQIHDFDPLILYDWQPGCAQPMLLVWFQL